MDSSGRCFLTLMGQIKGRESQLLITFWVPVGCIYSISSKGVYIPIRSHDRCLGMKVARMDCIPMHRVL